MCTSSIIRPLPLALLLLSAPTVLAEIGFAPDGSITIPAKDAVVTDGTMTASFAAERWGMYTLAVVGGDDGLEATVNGKRPERAGRESLGDFYIEKNGPCLVIVTGPTKGIESLVLTPTWEGDPVVQKRGAAIELDAKDCRIEGVMLRYEPNPQKLCIGYWGNPDDTPHWEFTVTSPGAYEVILTQGCGEGGGGSEAVLETAGVELPFTVQDTGAYQNWVERPLGKVTFKNTGRQALKVRIVKKARGIMDIRRIVLKPLAK